MTNEKITNDKLLDLLITLKIQWMEIVDIAYICETLGTNSSNIWKHLKRLWWLVERVWRWKYRLRILWSKYERDYHLRKIEYLTSQKIYYSKEYNKLIDCNKDLEKSCEEMRKSNDFLRKQDKIKDEVIKSLQDKIKNYESYLYRKKNWFRRLFGL